MKRKSPLHRPKCRLCLREIGDGDQFVSFQRSLFHARCYIEVARTEGSEAVRCDICAKGIRTVRQITFVNGQPAHRRCLERQESELIIVRTMPQVAALVTTLLMERPLCMDCVTQKAGVAAAVVEATLARLQRLLELRRNDRGRCRACDRTALVYSLARLAD